MSDFPIGGNIESTRAWLDKEGFKGLFIGWKAEPLLYAKEEYILEIAGRDEGNRLLGYLNKARRITGK